jgi:hypothetical protein
MSFFFGSVGPDDFARNYAGWARAWGLTAWADWLAQYATGPRVFWSVVFISLVYLVLAFALPSLVRRLKKSTAIVFVPIAVSCLVVGVLYGQYRIEAIDRWSITPQQKADLINGLSASPIKLAVPITIVPGAPSDAFDVAYEFMYVFNSGTGWVAALATQYDAEYSPHNTGVILTFAIGTDLSNNNLVKTLDEIFKGAGIIPVLTRSPNVPTDHVKLTIGRNP